MGHSPGLEALKDVLQDLEEEGVTIRSFCMSYVADNGSIGSVWTTDRTIDTIGLAYELNHRSSRFTNVLREGDDDAPPEEGRTFQ